MKQPTSVNQNTALHSLTANYLQTLKQLLSEANGQNLASLFSTIQRLAELAADPCFNAESRAAVVGFLTQACNQAAKAKLEKGETEVGLSGEASNEEERDQTGRSVPFPIKRDGDIIKEQLSRRRRHARKSTKTHFNNPHHPSYQQKGYRFLCDVCGKEFGSRAEKEGHKYLLHTEKQSVTDLYGSL